jgi:hypothetical protein
MSQGDRGSPRGFFPGGGGSAELFEKLSEVRQKTRWQAHAYRQTRNRFDLRIPFSCSSRSGVAAGRIGCFPQVPPNLRLFMLNPAGSVLGFQRIMGWLHHSESTSPLFCADPGLLVSCLGGAILPFAEALLTTKVCRHGRRPNQPKV